MRSVSVRVPAVEFGATMTAIGEWLNVNRYEPTRYKYDHNEDDVLVTVDFAAEVAAKAFAARFDGVHHFSLGSKSPGSSAQIAEIASNPTSAATVA